MSRKFTVLVMLALFLALVAPPASASVAPPREDSFLGDLIEAVRQWIPTLLTWPIQGAKHGCGIGPDGQPTPCKQAITKPGCRNDDAWEEPTSWQ